MRRGRLREVHVWRHLQLPLQGLDSGRAGKQSHQLSNNRYCQGKAKERPKIFLSFSEILTIVPRTLFSSFNVGHSPTPSVAVPIKPRLIVLKSHNHFFSVFLVFRFNFCLYIPVGAYSMGIKLIMFKGLGSWHSS